MAEKKHMLKIKLSRKQGLLIATIVVLVSSGIIAALYFSRKSEKQTLPQQPVSSLEDSRDSLSNPSVAAAKVKADMYFEAARKCDLELANSYRGIPRVITTTQEECLKECPSIDYEFIKPVAFNSEVVDGELTEYATFQYEFECKGNDRNSINIALIWMASDNTWYVFNTF